jgi:hypothetical protein
MHTAHTHQAPSSVADPSAPIGVLPKPTVDDDDEYEKDEEDDEEERKPPAVTIDAEPRRVNQSTGITVAMENFGMKKDDDFDDLFHGIKFETWPLDRICKSVGYESRMAVLKEKNEEKLAALCRAMLRGNFWKNKCHHQVHRNDIEYRLRAVVSANLNVSLPQYRKKVAVALFDGKVSPGTTK